MAFWDSESIFSAKSLWQDLHVQLGMSGEASILAQMILNLVEIDDFFNPETKIDHAQYSRIAAVTALAAFRKSKSWQEASEHLLCALNVVTGHYPMSDNEHEAKKRGKYWDGIYGENESAQLICLRDVWQLTQVLTMILPSEELVRWSAGLRVLLQEFSEKRSDDRFAMILAIENETYDKAKKHYTQFVEKMIQDKSFDANQMITVSARMMGRANDVSDVRQVISCLNHLRQWVKRSPKLMAFAMKEIGSNISAKGKKWFLQRKIQKWLTQANNDRNFLNAVDELLKVDYVGVGGEEVMQIQRKVS